MDASLVKELIVRAVTEIPPDVLEYLRGLPEGPLRDAILENVRVAAEERRPICQDTGLLTFVAEFSEPDRLRGLRGIIEQAVREATLEGYLRPNAISRPHRNPGDNIAPGHPSIVYVESDRNRLRVIPKGGGSIAVSRFYTLRPTEGLPEIERLIAKTVLEAGGKACPPYFVFASAGGSEESSVLHAKLAMLRDLRGPRTDFEERLLSRLNALGIGIMGLGIGPTVLDVRVEFIAKHPAVTALSVIVSCRALRKAYVDVKRRLTSSSVSSISSRCLPIR